MKSAPAFNRVVSIAGPALPALVLLGLAVPAQSAGALQVAVVVAWGLTAAICLVMLSMDSRTYRWGPELLWLGLLAAFAARLAAEFHLLPSGRLVLFGHQWLFVLLLASYLGLPWLRSAMQQRAMHRRAVKEELTAEQKIEIARNQLLDSLSKGLGGARDDGDVQWIAFRRLLDGLKPVLAQASSAVLAMNYHEEDMLQVEPRDAEPRYRKLIAQRGSMLRTLSRSKGPQQIVVDFDGPEGPLPQVQLAVIPLPIDKPGWGVLLVERAANVEYSELELGMCTEFAALATTASDEAAESVRARHAAEIDPETGLQRRALVEQALQAGAEQANKASQPLCILRLRITNLDELRSHGGASLHALAEFVRGELDFGESVGRYADDELLVVLPAKTTALAKPLAERIHAQAGKLPAPAPAVLVGMTEFRRGENAMTTFLDRAGTAVEAARRSGAPASA